jgi:hypothetical protein
MWKHTGLPVGIGEELDALEDDLFEHTLAFFDFRPCFFWVSFARIG